jgi:hypothetical protein
MRPSVSAKRCVALGRLASKILMRRMIVVLIAALVAMGAGTFKIAAAEKCMIADSALCAANPNCHWDYERRGCYPGPLARENPCSVHENSKVCETDVAIGCKWNAQSNKCESAK